MRSPNRNVDRCACVQRYFLPIESHEGGSFNNKPMFRSLGVLLITQSLARQHFNSFYLKEIALIQYGVSAPWSSIERSLSLLRRHWYLCRLTRFGCCGTYPAEEGE